MKKQVNKVYKNLRKNKTAIKIRAILMSGLLLAINSFAWFVFIANGNGKIKADVISWDIAFLDEEEQVEILDIELTDLYPGMDSYSKSIVIKNRSDLDATFSYTIESVIVYGKEYVVSDYVTSLQTDFPFTITFSHDKTDIDKGESLNFYVNVIWPFEAEEEYYKLNSMYPYLEGIDYYLLDNGSYTKTTVTSSNYNTLVTSGLYIESDDADSYWGEKSVTFSKEYPTQSAIQLKAKLIVTQKMT